MLFGDGRLLWFVCMLVSIACEYCLYVCLYAGYVGACRVGYASWVGLLLGGDVL